MKQILLTVFAFLYTSAIYAQSFNPTTQRDSILNQIYEDVGLIKFNQEEFGRYKIYQTDNIHILLKLDTATGIIKMLQWNLDRDKEFEVFINTEWLTEGGLAKKGRFELYPTKNMYQFILLDTFMGSTWHVQWGTQKGEYWIRKISLF